MKPMVRSAWNDVNNILCIRPDNMGDVLMTTPALNSLKTSGKKITLLASTAGAAIAKYIPCIDHIITFDPPWQHGHDADTTMVQKLIDELRDERFDGAIIFNVYSQNPLPAAMICYLAGIPRVAGFCRENPYRLITDWVPDLEPLYEIKHEVTRQMTLISALGFEIDNDDFVLTVPENASISTLNKMKECGIDPDKPWLVLHPGVSEVRRQYPIDSFAKVAHAISKEIGYQVVITGSADEEGLAERIIDLVDHNVFSLAGKLGLDELIALIDMAELLLSNNTGPVHIAAALKTPVIVTYALTNPQHSPWKVPHFILPFDIPDSLRSRNTIISFAYDKVSGTSDKKVSPEEIIQCVVQMLKGEPGPLVTEVISANIDAKVS